MIVLRRWPAWKGFAMLGEENSIKIRLLPFDGSSGSFRPRNLFCPKACFRVRMEGMTSSASLSTLKKNWRNVPLTVGLWTSGDSGNYERTSS
jgi:hypothetical protein